MTDETKIGGVNLSNIQSSTIQTAGHITASSDGGDVAGRDKKGWLI